MIEQRFTLVADAQMRIDKFLASKTEFSRAQIQQLIANHAIAVEGIIVRKDSFILRPGMTISISKPEYQEVRAVAREMPLNIVYEDEALAIIDKPSGLVVHPAPGHYDDTLVNGLVFRYGTLSSNNGAVRPGVIHRLDKDTSGLLIVAKNNEAHAFLAAELKARRIKRIYYALIEGQLENVLTHFDLPIGRDTYDRKKMSVKADGKRALTHVTTISVRATNSLVRCELETGRTHQIRVHLAYVKHPVVGDATYGHYVDLQGQRLHAGRLELTHPITRQQLVFESAIPAYFDLSPSEVKLIAEFEQNRSTH